jgi:serine/threonine-protein kinase
LVRTTDRLLGRIIAARYRLVRRLGAGGMSVVYLARHVLLDRLAAIKILRHDLGLNPAHRERFLREARAVNRINHRNIVEINDVGECDGTAYMVMEYVEGENLLSVLGKGPMPWPRACRIAVQVASALARAHQMGVIHRDLKPENVMLVSEFMGDAVKLMDFGIAKIVDMPALTFSEQLFGTPGYIAPEYVEGGAVDARSDIYALGVLLYEMVSGKLPYDAKGQADLLLLPITKAPTPLSDRVPNLPPELPSLVLRMLAKNPADRPHDAFAVHDALLDTLRRHENDSPAAPPVQVAPSHSAAPRTAAPVGGPSARQEIATDVRLVPSAPGPGPSLAQPATPGPPSTVVTPDVPPSGTSTAVLGRIETQELRGRWLRQLTELAEAIERSRRRGDRSPAAWAKADALAAEAHELAKRLDHVTRGAAEAQARLDRLEADAKDFRSNLGRAIDVLVHDRSRERAHLEALTIRAPISAVEPETTAEDSRVWERAALAEEAARTQGLLADLDFQIDELTQQLQLKNAELDMHLTHASGELEGYTSALRQLETQLMRTIDAGVNLVAEPRRAPSG